MSPIPLDFLIFGEKIGIQTVFVRPSTIMDVDQCWVDHRPTTIQEELIFYGAVCKAEQFANWVLPGRPFRLQTHRPNPID